ARRLPGLRSCEISAAPPRVLAGNPTHLVAELTFDSLADLDAALASPEGQATAGDLKNFAQAGVTLLVFDSEAV
ncbi:MAG: EthD family reductase, partial [Terriglobales bacterium]